MTININLNVPDAVVSALMGIANLAKTETDNVTPVAIAEEPKVEIPCDPATEELVGKVFEDAEPRDASYIRKAINRTRARIETTDEAKRRYHGLLNQEFKRIANMISGGETDKPTELRDAAATTFAAQCDDIQIVDNQIVSQPPF